MDQDFDQIDEAYENEADVESGFYMSKGPRTDPVRTWSSVIVNLETWLGNIIILEMRLLTWKQELSWKNRFLLVYHLIYH